MIVPMGKTCYIGRRKYVEGQVLPPHFRFEEFPVMTKAEAEAMAEAEEIKPKRQYHKKGLFGSSENEADE